VTVRDHRKPTFADFFFSFKVVVSVLCYRLTLHPLAEYPGPVLARLTDWIDTYQTSTGDRHLIQLEDHKKYGAYHIYIAVATHGDPAKTN
jgi:hypothetical protein